MHIIYMGASCLYMCTSIQMAFQTICFSCLSLDVFWIHITFYNINFSSPENDSCLLLYMAQVSNEAPGPFFFIVSQKLDWVNQFDMKYADNKWYRFIEFYFLYKKRELKRQRGMHFLDYEEILFGSNVTKCEFTLSIMKFIQTITLYQWFGYSRGRVLDDPFYFVQLPQFY